MANGEEEKKAAPSKILFWLKENERGKRLLIAFILFLSIALFLHFRDVRTDALEIDTPAKHYIVAQVDFDFPDEDATAMLRQQAMSDLGTVYKLDPKQIQERRLNFERELAGDSKWRPIVEEDGFGPIYNATDFLEKTLLKSQFTDPRTLQRIRDLGLNTTYYQSLAAISVESMPLPLEFWHRLEIQSEKMKEVSKGALNAAIQYFGLQTWNLLDDEPALRQIRESLSGRIPEKMSHMKAGSSIIDQGERVQQRHIDMMKGMKRALAAKQSLWRPVPIIGSLIFSLIIVSLSAFYFAKNQPAFFRSVRKLALFTTIVMVTLLLAKVTEYFLLESRTNLIEEVRYPLFTPFAAILLAVLLSHEIALFTTLFLSVIIGITLAFDHNRLLILNFIGGLVALTATCNLRKRKEVFGVCGKVWLITIPVLLGCNFMGNVFWDVSIITDIASSLVFLLITSILVVGLLPILESIFHVMTDITLMEYMDPSNELLRRLSLEAPGTYQHCLIVGSLAEAAAQAIGANGLFCRVSTLYHDVGKLMNPHYFTENQMGGFNIHQLLTPLESAQVIIAHVQEGVALAKKYGLPEDLTRIILEHHGTTLVYYFYCKQLEQVGGDTDAVDESKFRYPGPKPRSKESAIIMIADTVEAASRSLEDVNEEAITEMVERLVKDKADEGQFDDCQLTFEELGVVKKAMVRTLAVTRHLRVKYPDRKR